MDDPLYVTANQWVRGGLSAEGVRRAFVAVGVAANWHPLTWISHLLDVEFFGLDPAGHHLHNLLLHALAAALLCLVGVGATGSRRIGAGVSLLFAVHPLRVESVAWVAERKDVLSGLLFMAVLLSYLRHAARPRPAGLLRVAAWFALGLMAKPMLVSIPLLLLLLDWWPLGRRGTGGGQRGAGTAFLLAEKVPLLLLSLGSAALTLAAQSRGGAVTPLSHVDPGLRLANALWSLALYLGRTLWPRDLSVFYPHPGPAVYGRLPAALAVLAVLAAAAVLLRRRRPAWMAGLCWYLVALLPVLGLVQVGAQGSADRYTYLPLVGPLWALVAATVPRGGGGWSPRAWWGTLLAAAVLLGAATWRQATFWRDTPTLYQRSILATGDNWFLENNLGVWREGEGRYEEARGHYLRSIRQMPRLADSRRNLGNVLVRLDRRREAVEAYREAILLDPEDATAPYNLAVAQASWGDLEGAEESYRRALAVRPDFPEAHNNLGVILLWRWRNSEALAHFRSALAGRPDYAQAAYNAGLALSKLGRRPEAAVSFRQALALDPGYRAAEEALREAGEP
jgi:tetratricopeptide (TPR) repeat protein